VRDDEDLVPTKTVRLPVWDAELEQLVATAASLLGDEAVILALRNLFRHVQRDHPDGVRFSTFTDALKAELRRIVRPH
jgi:hypothetical protein